MPLSNFPFGVASFGSPMLPGSGVVVPTRVDASGIYFVDGVHGSDGNNGLSPQTAIKSLDVAYNLCLGGQNEIVYVIGGTSSVNLSSAIASGGAGNNAHVYDVFTRGHADAALLASILHFREMTIKEIKDYLGDRGITVRR